MCKPSVPKPKKVEEKPVQYLRNPFLDAINIGGGRNSLRIDLGSKDTGYKPPSYDMPAMRGAANPAAILGTFFGGNRRRDGGRTQLF
jgi:hypothetical protein